jgi:hypothetical protein
VNQIFEIYMKTIVINGKSHFYAIHPILALCADGKPGWSGVSDLFSDDEKDQAEGYKLGNLNDSFYWMRRWAKEKDYKGGYILDFLSKTAYYDEEMAKERLLKDKFPALGWENYFETFTKMDFKIVPSVPKIEPDKKKSEALKNILIERIKKGDKTPVKFIETISGSRDLTRIHFDFVPQVFEPKYQFNAKDEKYVSAIEGSAHTDSYRMDLSTDTRELIEDPSQATIFIDNVVNFVL